MKKLLFLILLFVFIVSANAQYIAKIDTATTLPATGIPLHEYISGGNAYIWAEGQWRSISAVASVAYSTTLFMLPNLVDSLLWNGKMDSVRVNALLGADTNRAIAREALKQNVIGNLGDTTKYLKTTAVKSGAYWDTTTYARGVVTIPAGDSIQVSITGLTSTSIATVAYKGGKMTADTMATWQVCTAGKLSIYGKFGKIISYIVGR